MRLSAPIFKLKREAKLLARQEGLALNQALDRVAASNGFRGWSHLAATASRARPAEDVLTALRNGETLLVGARPGHGKTLFGLELAASAARRGMASFFFTLDYNEGDVLNGFGSVGVDRKWARHAVVIDTSDDISAAYIADRLRRSAGNAVAVVDYLQLLDQRRVNPGVDAQLRALKAFAIENGAIIAVISQIDRAFELKAGRMPTIADVRTPNPIDLSVFDRTCFLHDGEIQFGVAA